MDLFGRLDLCIPRTPKGGPLVSRGMRLVFLPVPRILQQVFEYICPQLRHSLPKVGWPKSLAPIMGYSKLLLAESKKKLRRLVNECGEFVHEFTVTLHATTTPSRASLPSLE
jgi:hypothetical protein